MIYFEVKIKNQLCFTFQIKVPMYTTPYGPIIDGVVVPADPQLLMADPGAGNNYPRYDIMFGLTESESFHLFPASTGE